jgi:hypothetical protein
MIHMLSFSRPQLSHSIIFSAVALLCMLGINSLQIPRLNQLINKGEPTSVESLKLEEESERLRLNLIQKLPALGFDNLMANWVYLGFLQYFGDEVARSQTGYELSPNYFEIIVNRDPRFLGSYISLTSSISLYAGKPEQSVALMTKGLQTAQQSFEMAAQWASVYSDPDSQNVAAISSKTAQFLASNPDKRRIRIAQEGAWSLILVTAINANDDRTRQVVSRQIEARGGKVMITPQGGVIVQLPR